jgi:hypothetical protein
VRIAFGALNAGAATVASTIACASFGSRCRCDAVAANSLRSADTVFTVFGIGSAAPIEAAGDIAMRSAESVTSAPADQARPETYA